MKRILSMVILAVMMFSLIACSSKNNSSSTPSENNQSSQESQSSVQETKDGEGYVIGFCNYATANSWQIQMEAEFKYKAEALKSEGIIKDYYITNANGDVSKQISDFNDLMTKDVDAIIITAISPTALSPVCEKATEEGVKVIAFDSCVETDNVAGKVVSDDKDFGRVGAEFIVEKLDGKGDVVVLNGIAGSACSENRYAGAMEVFEKYSEINIVSSTDADWDYAKGKVAIESVISSGQNIDAVWSQGGAMTQAAVDAFNEAGLDLVPMSGEGNNGFLRTWKDNLDKGFTSICPWYPTYISTIAMDQALKALNGVEIEEMLVLPSEAISEEQIDEYYNPDLPDSYWVITDLTEDQVAEIFK